MIKITDQGYVSDFVLCVYSISPEPLDMIEQTLMCFQVHVLSLLLICIIII